MAMTFNRPAAQTPPLQTPVSKEPEIQPYDILQDQKDTQSALAHSPEVEALTADIDVYNLDTIITFGSHAADEVSKVSDVVLRSMSMSKDDDAAALLNSLAKIMDQFDINEIKENPSLFNKLFNNVKKQLEKLLAKYNTMGDEVDKIYVELKKYEAEIRQANKTLEQMFDANVDYFHELEKYIVAGDQGCEEIRAYIDQMNQQYQETGDQSLTFELQSLQQALDMLEQRTMDLRTVESVALQSIPLIKTQELANVNLMRKINSAFIITLPVFKQALAQAMLLKRQRIQADALSALDQRTNEMLLKNAKNTMEQAKMTTRMASGSSIRADTLETTWRTIMSGIEETQKIQESARAQRIQDTERLEAIKKEFNEKYQMKK